ncbi:acyl-CoA dehydrogenase family protein [Pseudarthrobacter raffinosi]|uniref:acyl-CoA dehydrogenase family protein n=1 Tax=Pseudarthrobacter raffinosi TaxID=2953651 RepID=UPI00208E39C2|nr:acyl-CoA dehydrogenase family protein [Pseudarthrobacter sp. MDT3-9]MCO4252133.1 acyl-CoA dehydrogenase family protein [Pseudarthrobacter sp. MDT3-9]
MADSLSSVYQSMVVDGGVDPSVAVGSVDYGERNYTVTYEVDEKRNDLIATAASFKDMLRESAREIDETRRVPEHVIEALADAGLFKLGVPKRYGGHEADIRTIIDVAATLAESCGSTAWVVTLINTVGIGVGMLPKQTQDEVFGANPDARVAGVFSPRGESRRVDGGFRVNGTWYYGSGTLHSDWVMVGFPLVDESGETIDFGLGLIPRPDYIVEDTWHVVGMRGSGSNAIVVEDAFIPDHRILSVARALSGDYPTEYTDEPLYRSAFQAAFTLVLTGAQLGLGRAALRLAVDQAEKRTIPNTIYTQQRESVGFQLQIADAAMLIDAAHFHVYRAAADIDEAAKRDEYPSYVARARIRADAARAATCVKEAIDTLLTAHGAGSFAESSPMQRMWRDSNIAGRHGTLVPPASREIYGKALLGFSLEENITRLL